MPNIEFTARLVDKLTLNPKTVLLTFHCPPLAGKFAPGQFFEMECGGYIMRPFAVFGQNPQEGTFSVGVETVGPRSAELAAYPTGKVLRVVGPLGHGFDLQGYDHIIGVGGGSGIFPVTSALIAASQKGCRTALVCGFTSADLVYDRALFTDLEGPLYCSSDQGGLDYHGNAVDCFVDNCLPLTGKRVLLIACGPLNMQRALRDVAVRQGLDAQFSLAPNMACGLGLCDGCSIDLRGPDGERHRVRCCKQGPVFPARQIIFPGDEVAR